MAHTDQGRGRGRAKGVHRGATALVPRANLAEFAKSPFSSYLTGSTWLYAWPTPTLCVSVLHGVPNPDDMEALTRLFALELVPPARPHASIIDARRVGGVDQAAFTVLARYVEARREEMARQVTRLAIVRPDGFVGALAAGFYQAVPPPYAVESFEDFASALAWAAPGGPTQELDRVFEELVASTTSVPEIVRTLRHAIEARLPEATIDRAAADLGMAVRTLQRKLGAAETTFRAELVHVQVERAKHWLVHTDAAISRIAYELGLSTPQHFSALFRKATDKTPTEYRDEHRRGP